MVDLKKEFFPGDEVLFMGYSAKNQGFSSKIYQAFSNHGIKVYPLNSKESENYAVKVYKSIDELPRIPKTAYILLNKESTRKVIKELSNKGIKNIVFQRSGNVDRSILEECTRLGMKTIVACPMMSFGSGIHRFHGLLAGIR